MKKNIPDIDLVLWTGDNTNHEIWNQSLEGNMNNTLELTKRMQESLNVTVIPIMGNHESYPVNVYNYFDDSEGPLNEGFSKAW